MKILSVGGARPNFMKLASIAHAVEKHNRTEKNLKIEHLIVHTGQHYDNQMSQQFFCDLQIPMPKINLEVGSGSHAQQTAEIMKRFEPVLLDELPDFLLVVGDVNSTISCCLVASKIHYPDSHELGRPFLVHVEAGLRSFDRAMPEEINRILTDSICDFLFVTEESAIMNLKDEGVQSEKIYFVGNVMIDTLNRFLKDSNNSKIKNKIGLHGDYAIVTLHRPSNVDQLEILKSLMQCISLLSKKLTIVFSVHPRTEKSLKHFDLFEDLENNKNIILTKPLGYIDFIHLLKDAALVLTDSGGIQEESTALRIPCITLRNNTERPITVTKGSNYLIGTNPNAIIPTVDDILSGNGKSSTLPKYWDGASGERIIKQLKKMWFRER